MKILVCIRQGLDGEINPFDASAYEAALQIKDAEIILMSMGPLSAKGFLLKLTRLGAKRAILLSDKAFAGADTIATAYTLSLAVKKINPDLIFCGRQTFVGDTAQTGPMLAVYAQISLVTNVMSIDRIEEWITCTTRDMGVQKVKLPALFTIERIHNLRLPSILSKLGEVEVWNALDLGADVGKCGLAGSPTRVLETFENRSGKRKCQFISWNELPLAIEWGLQREKNRIQTVSPCKTKLNHVCIVGEGPRSFAETVSDDIIELPISNAKELSAKIMEIKPTAVLWGSDWLSKKIAAQVSAMLHLGLCADCTALEVNDGKLIMYRPALSGSIIAKIESRTSPVMATVRTNQSDADILVAAGFGVKDHINQIKDFADSIGAQLVTTRKAVDNNVLPYHVQVGLTGQTVCPSVYVAIGVSGAIHHVVGMQQAGTVIAINPDKDAPIFEYADYGIVGKYS